MKIGLIAGNRLFPLLLAQSIKQRQDGELIGICFKGETHGKVAKVCDRAYWVHPTHLGELQDTLAREHIKKCVMAGQINPLRIFKKKNGIRCS